MMVEKLKEYMVFAKPQFPPAEIVDNKLRVEWMRAQDRYSELRIAFSKIVEHIQSDIAPNHKIKIIHDGSGWGVDGHKFTNCSWIFIKTTQAAIAAIEKIDGVSGVTANDMVASTPVEPAFN